MVAGARNHRYQTRSA